MKLSEIHEMMARTVPMLEYCYGVDHPLTIAARARDCESFKKHGGRFTEDDSVSVCRIIDAINFKD